MEAIVTCALLARLYIGKDALEGEVEWARLVGDFASSIPSIFRRILPSRAITKVMGNFSFGWSGAESLRVHPSRPCGPLVCSDSMGASVDGAVWELVKAGAETTTSSMKQEMAFIFHPESLAPKGPRVRQLLSQNPLATSQASVGSNSGLRAVSICSWASLTSISASTLTGAPGSSVCRLVRQ